MKTFVLPVALAGLVLVATPALAVPVEWTINGTFEDGGTISGTYTYDNDVPGGLYTNINVTTTAGTPAPILATGASYTVLGGFGASNGFEFRTTGGTADGQRTLLIDLVGNMGNAGGVRAINLVNSTEGLCTGGNCTGVYASPRLLVSGSVTGVVVPAAPAAVPTLTEWAMIGLTGMLAAAGALIAIRRRRLG